jgi:NADPH-dependent dioxygenase
MLSLELARRGVEARTVDRLPRPGATSRALTVHARTLEIIERIDRGLLERFLERGIHNKGYVLHFLDAQGRRSEVRPGIDFTTLDSRYPYILVHGQSDTENYLRDYMRDELGRTIEWNTQCTGLRQDANGITATLVHRDRGDEEERVRCRYLVACDGINSRVRGWLGLAQAESDYKGTVLQNMDVVLENFPDAEDYVHYCAGTDHFIMIVKLPGGFFRLLLSDRGEAADPNVSPEQGFKRLVDRHFDGVSLGDVVWHSKWESWVRLADTYRAGNVFLAGDSAHVHSTTGGQGVNCCMQDAYNLGWKLALVVAGDARPELLDSYEAERRPIAEQVIWAASSLHEIFMGHGKDIAERAKKISDAGFLDQVVGRCSGISYTYRDYLPQADEAATMPGPALGDRAPDVDFPSGGSLFDLTRHSDFTLLVVPGSRGAGDAQGRDASLEQLAALEGRFGHLVRTKRLERCPALAERYGETADERLFLLRPDGYVGFRCGLADAAQLETLLDSILVGAI